MWGCFPREFADVEVAATVVGVGESSAARFDAPFEWSRCMEAEWCVSDWVNSVG